MPRSTPSSRQALERGRLRMTTANGTTRGPAKGVWALYAAEAPTPAALFTVIALQTGRPGRHALLPLRTPLGVEKKRESPPCLKQDGLSQKIWGERWDLNPRPPGPQPGALPAELLPPRKSFYTQRPFFWQVFFPGMAGACSFDLEKGKKPRVFRLPASVGSRYPRPVSAQKKLPAAQNSRAARPARFTAAPATPAQAMEQAASPVFPHVRSGFSLEKKLEWSGSAVRGHPRRALPWAAEPVADRKPPPA